MKKTYEIELRRTSYIVLTIEAENEDEAQKKAWDEIERGDYKHEDAQWDIESIEEATNQGESE
jgi:hypothetical protein